ncbi:DUF1345 domain-containing protein [Sphingomonas sp. KR1UV-12]|uniref:DUF1345 domain-containing protein n=1 Tax=Sphingomonas aurea TaxID=3063994 RepID=A0ABT9EPK1_9SPHN|nr:DUF1345 domain-containing protein [Sphingomonas sp. KR1UV-12]MDP1028568.1 DUF1345 domain-containing protein [Sphingomonas sp. KR1UV-12]
MTTRRWWGLGQRVAPPRFVLFVLVLAAALPATIAWLGRGRGIMIAFDLAALVFLTSLATLLSHGEPARMRRAARDNDANRAVLLGFAGITMAVILIAVAGELKGRNDGLTIALVIATLVLAWLFSNTVYALHYAHLWYSEADGRDAGGLDFPGGDPTPDYWDFLYFSFTLGMTFQTSDVTIGSSRIRRVVLGHTLVAFIFNLGVLAFTVNVIGGS